MCDFKQEGEYASSCSQNGFATSENRMFRRWQGIVLQQIMMRITCKENNIRKLNKIFGGNKDHAKFNIL